MHVKSLLAATLAATLVTSNPVSAQEQQPAAKSRPEVKAEARTAAKTGRLAADVDVEMAASTPRSGTARSSKTRAERKADTLNARKNGQLPANGEMPGK